MYFSETARQIAKEKVKSVPKCDRWIETGLILVGELKTETAQSAASRKEWREDERTAEKSVLCWTALQWVLESLQLTFLFSQLHVFRVYSLPQRMCLWPSNQQTLRIMASLLPSPSPHSQSVVCQSVTGRNSKENHWLH